MGSVGGMLGLAGGAAGSGFSGPQAANIQTPTTNQQATDAYTSNQNALAQQQSFMQALQGQNGIQNQSNTYSQLQGIANGTGPNPAQAQLAQATGANVANQAALMAGQRGSSQNAGMIARQAAQVGANAQQQSAGQAASLQAQQSLNAIGAQGNIAGQQVGNLQNATAQNTQAQQSEQQNLLNAIAGQNNAAVNQQSNINTVNGQLASNTQQQQGQIIGGIGNGLGALAEGGMVRKPYANGDLVSVDYDNKDPVQYGIDSTPAINANAGTQPAIGQVPNAAATHAALQAAPKPAAQGAQSSLGKFMQAATSSQGQQSPLQQGASNLTQSIGHAIGSMFQPSNPDMTNEVAGGPQDQGMTISDGTAYAASGGKVPALVSPGERYLPPQAVAQVMQGKDPMKAGEKISGTPKVGGAKNSYANDTVPKTLEEGGVVLPRSVTKAKAPSEAGRRFVEAIAKKHGMKVK